MTSTNLAAHLDRSSLRSRLVAWALPVAVAMAGAASACSSDLASNVDEVNEEGDDEGTGAGASDGAGGSASTGSASTGSGSAGAGLDPFAPQPDTSMGLVNVSADLAQILENGSIEEACLDYEVAPDDPITRLRCGKAMFFYEGFGIRGIPKGLVTWLLQSFPDDLGPGFSKLGLVADPFSPDGLPLGMGDGAPLGSADTLSFTCASCHFGKLSDGRYAVGAPNHDFDYGRFNLVVALLAQTATFGWNDADHHPDALAAIEPMRSKLDADWGLKASLIGAVLPLLGADVPAFTKEHEAQYASWRTGTMDFFIAPVAYDDGVHTISKISPLWGIPSDAELVERDLSSAMLGWTGGTRTLGNFVHAFVELGPGDLAAWPDERLAPLRDYVLSLRSPASPASPSSGELARGEEVFASACLSCHGELRGMGDRIYSFEEIGTDPALRAWADGADLDGIPAAGITFPEGDTLTHGVKSPRLVGLGQQKRFLHNGSLDSLEQLLCLAPRPGISALAYSDAGHTNGCDLPQSDRTALLAYLRAH